MRRILPLLAAVAALGLVGCGAEPPASPSVLFKASKGGGGGGSTDIPVTATIADADASVAPALQLTSDGFGSYQNSSTLTSLIQAIGAWVLDSYNPRGATRAVTINFGRPVAGSGPGGGDPVAPPSGVYRARLIAKCNLYGVTIQGIAPGASTICPLRVRFDAGGGAYALQMNPQSGDQDGVFPETEPARVTCTASVSGACTGWRITPTGSGGNVAKLLQYVTVKGKTTPVDRGDFVLAFAITVTR